MPKLNDLDFKYWKDCISDDIKEHDTKLNAVNNPAEVIDAYNGVFEKFDVGSHPHEKTMIENYLFVAAGTILPSLFFQWPRIIIRSDRLPFEAAVLTGLVDKTFTERDKEENQLCIIDAFLPYGFSVMKNGYNSRMGKVLKKPNFLTGRTQSNNKSGMETDFEEYLKYERPIGVRQSPKYTYLDHRQPFGKGNRITFEYTRTLQQLIGSNLYDLPQNFIEFFGSRSKDKRKVDLKIFESFILLGQSTYKLAFCEEWQQEPIAWIKTDYEGLPASYLRFNKMGDVLYGIAHGTLGLRAQKELNYLMELWKQHLDHIKNQIAAHKEAFNSEGQKVLRDNKIGGIAWTNRPLTTGVFQQISSALPDPRLFENIMNVREYLKLLMSTTGGKGGGPESELATTERSKALGDALRSAGLQDAIRDFLTSQIKQRIRNIIKMGSPELAIKLTGENLIMPDTGREIEPGTELILGGKTGLSLQDLITGNIDIDFVFDIDMTSAQRPDFPVIRKQLGEGIIIAERLEPRLAEKGKKINFELMLEDYFATLDTVPDAKKYISEMSDEEREMWKVRMMMQGAGELPEGTPNEASIERSAEAVPTGAKGLGIEATR